MVTYGYIPVSSKSQEQNYSCSNQQEEILKKYEIDEFIIETGSVTENIPEKLFQLIERTERGDTIIVSRVDRFARSTMNLLNLVNKLRIKGVSFIALDLPFSTDESVRQYTLVLVASLAEFETNRRKERQREGILKAQRDGKYLGRKSVITDKFLKEVDKLMYTKQLSILETAKILDVSRPTI